ARRPPRRPPRSPRPRRQAPLQRKRRLLRQPRRARRRLRRKHRLLRANRLHLRRLLNLTTQDSKRRTRSQTAKLSPHEQCATAFGLVTLNPPFCRSSLKSSNEPLTKSALLGSTTTRTFCD